MRNMALPLLAAATLLADCTTIGAGSSNHVTVSAPNAEQAQLSAEKHCEKFGKVARAGVSKGHNSFTFECQAP